MNRLVKLVSLKFVNLGEIKVVELTFDESGKLVIKGGSGSGKTTLQKGVKAITSGTSGNNPFSHNDFRGYKLQGCLIDGDYEIQVQVTEKEGKPKQILSAVNTQTGEEVKEIDGISLTAKDYLSMFNDSLVTGLKEFCEENPTKQRNFSFKLFKNELAKAGVSALKEEYNKTFEEMQSFDYARKQVGEGVAGTDEWLRRNSIAWDRKDTHPKAVLTNKLDEELISLKVEKKAIEDEPEKAKKEKLEKLKSKMSVLVSKIETFNSNIEQFNDKGKQSVKEAKATKESVKTGFESIRSILNEMVLNEAMKEENAGDFIRKIEATIKSTLNKKIEEFKEKSKIILKDGKVSSEQNKENLDEKGLEFLNKVIEIREKWGEIKDEKLKETSATTEIDKQIKIKETEISNAKTKNLHVKALTSFFDWQKKRDEVEEKKLEINRKYEFIDTGVEGLKFLFDGDDVNLCYNGCADPEFFKTKDDNGDLFYKSVHLFSESQIPLIALYLQLSRKAKKSKSIAIAYYDKAMCDDIYRLATNAAEKYNIECTIICSQIGSFKPENLEFNEVILKDGHLLFGDKEPEKLVDEKKEVKVEEEKNNEELEI